VKRILIRYYLLAAVAGAIGCSSAASPNATAPAPTPTPGILSRLDPNVVEETATYVIHRLPKNEYLRVDERHIRHPLITQPVEFFKEDEKYYYIQTQRWTPEEIALRQAERQAAAEQKPTATPEGNASPPVPEEYTKPSPSDFEDLFPKRATTRLKLQKVSASGLPDGGMWRASFVLADVNQDGILDVVAPAPRLGGATPNIWLGRGTGAFSEWPLTFMEDGVPSTTFGIGYGAVATGDIDGDGKVDLVTASHGFGLSSLFGDGRGGFRVLQKGLPNKEFSSQAITLLDVDGDGKLDIVASRDILVQDHASPGPNVRVYLYRGAQGWEFKKDALVRGIISNSLHSWDFDGDGRKDLLTGSHQFATVPLLWRNEGGAFAPVKFGEMEVYAFHLATVPGTFGPRRIPAFADAFHLFTKEPTASRATGINIYSFEGGAWKRNRVWRQKEGKSSQYALAMGDLDGDGLDDVAFADTEEKRLRIFFQGPDGSFEEMSVKDEPVLDSPGQCIRIGDLDRDGRADIVLSKTISSTSPTDPGGWDVYLNKPNRLSLNVFGPIS
jgi:FG-GAP-like repeat